MTSELVEMTIPTEFGWIFNTPQNYRRVTMTAEDAAAMAKPLLILKENNGWWMQWAVLHAFNEVCHWTPFARLVQSVGVEGFGRLVRPLTESAIAELKTRQSYGHTAYRDIYPILAQ